MNGNEEDTATKEIDDTEEQSLGVEDLDLELDEGVSVEYEDETSDDDTKETADLEEEKRKQEQEKEEQESDESQEEEEAEDTETEDEDTTDSDEEVSEEDEGEAEDEPVRLVDDIAQRTGLEFEEGELDGIEDTEEGLVELSEKIAQKRSQQMVDEYLEEHPMTKKLMEFEQMGGDPEDFRDAFMPETDYQQVEVEEDDVERQKDIIKRSLKEKGFSDERIQRNLEMYEDGGVLYDEAQDSLEELRQSQEKRKEQLMKEQEKQFEEAQKQAEQTWNKIEETIEEKDNFHSIPLPKKDKKKFREFITPNEEEGVSPRDKKISEMSLEDQLTLDLILFHGLDSFSEIIDSKAKTKSTKSLKERLKKQKEKNKSDEQEDVSKQASADDLEFRI